MRKVGFVLRGQTDIVGWFVWDTVRSHAFTTLFATEAEASANRRDEEALKRECSCMSPDALQATFEVPWDCPDEQDPEPHARFTSVYCTRCRAIIGPLEEPDR